ncbi:sorbosone dehydrogenase family protein [Altericroceibacterium spongiae]|uniref:Sorbosone dehydrogenase family protein n=1 Tax=Altericroceibacterium spongiae TaxID=2320269 RepID=A0A420EM99_9SPHN|nr:sorbosone dehydrogenase family protein [Altericroceibacterium spongiae]RKF21852.1 sorbosone dehydrogenase family protein [Altericroceibacterium spongiae]
MMRLHFCTLVAASLTLTACGMDQGDPDQNGPDPALPEQNETLLPPMHIATPAGWGDARPAVPEGFTVQPIATGLKIPRQTLVLPNGDILVAEGSGGNRPTVRPKDLVADFIKSLGKSDVKGGDRITLLRDEDGDGLPDLRKVFIGNLNAPYGLAYYDGNLYVADQDALLRFPYEDGQTQITAKGEALTPLPSKINHHWTKSLTISPDGSTLYVGIGSNSNVGERGMAVEEDRARIWAVDRETGAHRTYASGIRNPTALAMNPASGDVWAVANERDELGARLVPDYLTSVREGAFYGWPYSYWGDHVDPRVRPQKPEKVAEAIAPDYSLGSHKAPLGLSFTTGKGFGGSFANGAFVGEHGSWNRQDLAGYKVVYIPFRNGHPAGDPVDFVSGFLDGDGHARGRPVGVTFDSVNGALLVADDLSNTLWRIAPANGMPQSDAEDGSEAEG